MSLFRCDSCGCVENTATSRYWFRDRSGPALCSECDPAIGKWHGCFPKQDVDDQGYVQQPGSYFIEQKRAT